MADQDPIEEGALELPGRAVRMRRAIRGLAVDVAPLRSSRDFRTLWLGQLISETGHQVYHVAVYIQVFALTKSAAAVGLVGLAELVPLALSSIGGGSIVDAVDRRKLLLGMQFGFALTSTMLLLNALAAHPPVALVYLGAGMTAALGGIEAPTRSAMTPRLVSREQLPSAIAINQVMWNTTMIVGPALGGILIAHVGLAWAYAVDVITYAAAIVAVLMIRPMPPEGETRATGTAAIREGFRYLKGRRVLQSTFAIDLIAMIFGMPRALFPVLALTQFHRGAHSEVVGFLFSAVAVGALAGALSAGWVGRIRHQGRAVIWAVAIWGAGIVGFGLSGNHLLLAYVFLAVAGGADVISAVFRSAILQLSVPDKLRGRLSAIHILVVTGGPRLGDVEAGVVAQVFTPFISVVSGGVACLAGVAILALAVPELARYHAGAEA